MKAPNKTRANARIRMLLVELHRKVDKLNAVPLPDWPPVTCSSGCTHARTGCCALLTTIDAHEAALIVDRNPEAVEHALPALLAAADKLNAAGITEQSFGKWLEVDDGEARRLEREVGALYRRLDLPCAFLGDGNRCTIYQDRPLACRTHHVVTDPAECSVWDIPQGDDRYARLDRGGARANAPAALIRAQMAAGMAIEWGALPLVVLAAHRRRHG
jgi:Fe-S-cluster containining protein